MVPHCSQHCSNKDNSIFQIQNLASMHLVILSIHLHIYLLSICCDFVEVFFVFFCEPAVTRSVAMACSSCVMASLSSSLLKGIFIRSGFFAVSSVSIHWKRRIHKHRIGIFLKHRQKSKIRSMEKLTFSEGLYSGSLIAVRILVTSSSEIS